MSRPDAVLEGVVIPPQAYPVLCENTQCRVQLFVGTAADKRCPACYGDGRVVTRVQGV